MKVRFSCVAVMSLALFCLGLCVGCDRQGQTDSASVATESADSAQHADGVDPHDVPLTAEQKQQLREETAKFGGAVARIKKFRDVIQQETSAGLPANPLAAHQALDQADLLCQWLPEIARNSDIAKEHWETVTTAANQLRELFEKVHQRIDDKADPDFASIEQQMGAKIAELEVIAQ